MPLGPTRAEAKGFTPPARTGQRAAKWLAAIAKLASTSTPTMTSLSLEEEREELNVGMRGLKKEEFLRKIIIFFVL